MQARSVRGTSPYQPDDVSYASPMWDSLGLGDSDAEARSVEGTSPYQPDDGSYVDSLGLRDSDAGSKCGRDESGRSPPPRGYQSDDGSYAGFERGSWSCAARTALRGLGFRRCTSGEMTRTDPVRTVRLGRLFTRTRMPTLRRWGRTTRTDPHLEVEHGRVRLGRPVHRLVRHEAARRAPRRRITAPNKLQAILQLLELRIFRRAPPRPPRSCSPRAVATNHGIAAPRSGAQSSRRASGARAPRALAR